MVSISSHKHLFESSLCQPVTAKMADKVHQMRPSPHLLNMTISEQAYRGWGAMGREGPFGPGWEAAVST